MYYAMQIPIDPTDWSLSTEMQGRVRRAPDGRRQGRGLLQARCRRHRQSQLANAQVQSAGLTRRRDFWRMTEDFLIPR